MGIYMSPEGFYIKASKGFLYLFEAVLFGELIP
jgi:hypothetical protein